MEKKPLTAYINEIYTAKSIRLDFLKKIKASKLKYTNGTDVIKYSFTWREGLT